MYDYLDDEYGKICIEMARNCKTDVGFGAVLVKDGKIIGVGRNRRSNATDRILIPYVDYAIHAEQDSILNALLNGIDVKGSIVHVLGECLKGKNKGKLTVRTEGVFICSKCPHVFSRYDISVKIPHIDGWYLLTASEAMQIGKKLANKGYWKEFVSK